jgi:hypothetical protein
MGVLSYASANIIAVTNQSIYEGLSHTSWIAHVRLVRFEVFTAVNMKNGVFWDVTPCVSGKNQRFG